MNSKFSGSQLLRTGLAISVWIAIAAAPVMIVGLSFEDTAAQWVASLTRQPTKLLGVSFLLLASDIFLPVPSSFVCTLCGQSVAWLLATSICGTGMFVGSITGFALSRTWGRKLAEKYSAVEHLELLDCQLRRTGIWWLLLLRPVPILAEAAVLLCGVHMLPWSQFLGAVGASSFVTAAAFCLLGILSQQGHWTYLAWCISLFVPLAALFFCKFILRALVTTVNR